MTYFLAVTNGQLLPPTSNKMSPMVLLSPIGDFSSYGIQIRTEIPWFKVRDTKPLYYTAIFWAVRTGFEPATSSVTGWHSNQLNYRTIWHIFTIIQKKLKSLKIFGRCGIRTREPIYGLVTFVTCNQPLCQPSERTKKMLLDFIFVQYRWFEHPPSDWKSDMLCFRFTIDTNTAFTTFE